VNLQAEARRILAERELERRRVRYDLSLLLDRMSMVDEKTGEVFRFYLNDPDSPWYWQRTLVWDVMATTQIRLFYKARQLGITWIAAARQLARALTLPGTRYLVFRQREEDALEIVNRQWQLLCSLPEHLRFGTKVITPHRGLDRDDVFPDGEIKLLHRNGVTSSIKALPPTGEPGHGETVAGVLLDEAARIKKLREVLKAVMATVGTLGEVDLVSTANGVANEDGEGNHFAHLWNTAEERGITKVFLPTDLHPLRDERWYETAPEYLVLDTVGRAEQYPRTPEEGFQGTAGLPYFDPDALAVYAREKVAKPLYRCEFKPVNPRVAKKVQTGANGLIRVYEEPRGDATYGIAVDVATGRGRDNSAVYVINFTSMALSAEIRAKIDVDKLAFQLHYLGRWYGTRSGCERDALIAIETATGHGEAVIVPLRDGREGRPKYTNLYYHRPAARPAGRRPKDPGFRIGEKTRPRALSLLAKAIRDQELPWMTSDLLFECRSFVHHDQGTSPRAAEGCNDDAVLAAAIALELYRQKGHHPNRRPKKSQIVTV